jgi:hypothetical protein
MTTSDFLMVLFTSCMIYMSVWFIGHGVYWGLLMMWFNMKMFDIYCLKRKYDTDNRN